MKIHTRLLAAFLAAVLSVQMFAVPALAGELPQEESTTSEWVEAEDLPEDDLMPKQEEPSALESALESAVEPSQQPAQEEQASSEESSQPSANAPTEEEPEPADPIAKPEQIAALLFEGDATVAKDDLVQLSFEPVEGAKEYRARLFLEQEDPSAVPFVPLTNWKEETVDGKTVCSGELTQLELQKDQNYRVELIAVPQEDTQVQSEPFVTYLRAANQPEVTVQPAGEEYALVWTPEEELSYQVVQQDGTPLEDRAVTETEETASTTVSEPGVYFVQPFAEEVIDGQKQRRYGLTREVLVEVQSLATAPANFAVKAGNGKVQLSWDPVAGTSVTYVVKKAEKDGALAAMEPITATSYEDTAVVNNTTYQYAVYAVIDGIATADSAVLEAMPNALVAPTATIKQIGFALELSWNDVAADQYLVYRDDVLIQTLSGTQRTVQDLPAEMGTEYTYRVEAKRGETEVAAGQPVVGKLDVAAPTGLRAKAGDAQVQLNWTKHADAKSYVVRYGTKTVVVKTNAATIKGLSNKAKYTFTVSACANADGTGLCSTPAAVQATPMVVRPATPKNFKIVQGNLKMNLYWSKVSGATQYEVWRYKTAVKAYVKVATVTGDRWTDTDIKSTSDYRYRVRAVRVSGGQSGASAYTETLIYRGVKTVAKVTGVKAVGGESRVTVTWNKVSNADGYYIYRYNEKTKKYEKVNSTNGATKYINTGGVENGKTYYYKVRAYEEVSQRVISGSPRIKVFSEEYSATAKATPQILIPGKVEGVKASQSSKTKVSVQWAETKNATGYRVYRYNDKTKKYETLRDTTSLTVTDSKSIAVGKTYKYRVRAYRVVKDVRYYSKEYSATVSIKILQKSKDELLKEEALATVHAIYYRATVRTTSKKYTGHFYNTYVGTVSSGTSVKVLYRTENSRCKVELPSGQIVYLNTGNLRFNSNIYDANAYSDEIAQAYVNAKKFSSETDWLVWLSTYSQRVFVFKRVSGKWELRNSSTCASGKMATPTPHGHHEVEYRNRRWDYGTYHVNYPVTFTIPKNYPHGNAFHSRIYWNDGSLKDGTQGRPVSNGCPRLPDDAIKYIYNNVPTGSKVLSY